MNEVEYSDGRSCPGSRFGPVERLPLYQVAAPCIHPAASGFFRVRKESSLSAAAAREAAEKKIKNGG